MLARLAQLRPSGYLHRSRMLFDADCRQTVEKALTAIPLRDRPDEYWAGDAGLDLESLFCEPDFLEQMFRHFLVGRGAPPRDDLRSIVDAAVQDLAPEKKKGDDVLLGLFDMLFSEGERKPRQLGEVVDFLRANRTQPWAEAVWNRTQILRDAVDVSVPKAKP